jgi:pSer/pThr/pTyr-binding forkhead associated (FHA) protein
LRQLASRDGEDSLESAETTPVGRTEDGDEFIAACGARLPLRLSITDERSGESEDVLVERPWALIGGDNVCDIRLNHPDVSQRHAYLQFVASRILCCDLGSRTGTHWSNEIRSRSWLKSGEPIFIGPYSIRLSENDFVLDGTAAPTIGRGGKSDPELPRVTLAFVNACSRSGRSRVSRIKRPVTLVGWSHLCNLRLQHASVGRVHCSLVWTPSGLWVVDLLCRGGTRVNGKLVAVAHLAEGDEIAIGGYQLRVSYGNSAETEEDAVPEPDPQVTISVVVPGGHPESLAPVFNSQAELMNFEPKPLALPQGHSLSDSVALAMMQQFSVMQQQLFAHTQQLLQVMAQSFSAAHAQQLALIREELFRVHDVNRELQELNLKLANPPEPQRAAEGRAAPPRAIEARQTIEPAQGVEPSPVLEPPEPFEPPMLTSKPDASDVPGASNTGPNPDSLEGPHEAIPFGAAREPAPQPPLQGPPADHPGPSGSNGAPQGSEGSRHGSDGEMSASERHARLCARINALEHERTTRWQKILRILTLGAGRA